METLIFPMILLGILIVFGIVFLVVTKKQQKVGVDNKAKEGSKSTNKTAGNENIKREDVFKFMEFERILDDMIVQNNGTKYTMAIKCKGINYDLMSDVEQVAVEEGFITFLNTLRYPIQLYVQAQNIDLKGAINTYKQNVANIRNEFEKVNEEYTRLADSFEATEVEIARAEKEKNKVLNVYEYASDIIQYVERLSVNKNLLQRNFYVLVSYHTSEITSSDKFTKEEIINLCYTELLTRCESILSGLSACSVSGEKLNSNELADLLYNAYNRDDKGLLSVKDAIDSGFYRLYSTSKEAFDKKSEMLQEEIENEAKLKAITALKKAVDDNTYRSPLLNELDFEEQSSKMASEIVKSEDLPKEVKDKAQNILVEDYKETKKNIIEQMAIERINIKNMDENGNVVIPEYNKMYLDEENEENLEGKPQENNEIENIGDTTKNENTADNTSNISENENQNEDDEIIR